MLCTLCCLGSWLALQRRGCRHPEDGALQPAVLWGLPFTVADPKRETSGTGFVLRDNLIVTNAHVIADSTYVTVKRHGSGSRFRAGAGSGARDAGSAPVPCLPAAGVGPAAAVQVAGPAWVELVVVPPDRGERGRRLLAFGPNCRRRWMGVARPQGSKCWT
jgi:hypothetical protein